MTKFEHFYEQFEKDLRDGKLDTDDLRSAVKEAYNLALDEAAENAKWKSVPPRMTNMDGIEVDKSSILDLKIK